MLDLHIETFVLRCFSSKSMEKDMRIAVFLNRERVVSSVAKQFKSAREIAQAPSPFRRNLLLEVFPEKVEENLVLLEVCRSHIRASFRPALQFSENAACKRENVAKTMTGQR